MDKDDKSEVEAGASPPVRPSTPLLEFVRELARHQARIDARIGVRFAELENYSKDPSEKNRAGVLLHMNIALDILRNPPRSKVKRDRKGT